MTKPTFSPRAWLLDAFGAALKAVEGRAAVCQALQDHPWSADTTDPFYLLSVGKAGISMAQGVEEVLGDRVARGLVVTKLGYSEGLAMPEHLALLEAEHPVPGSGSLAAGRAVLGFCDQLPENARVIVCISGGASSLMEVLPDGLELDDLQGITGSLLADGSSIERINALRRRISGVKAGHLAEHLAHCNVLALYISDVPGSELAMIGSGPLIPDPTQDASPSDWLASYPETVRQRLQGVSLPAPAKDSEQKIEHRIVADSGHAVKAVAQRLDALESSAGNANLPIVVHDRFLEGPAGVEAGNVVKTLLESEPAWHVWGGETVVELPETPGRGGRNQHFALAAAELVAGREDIFLLACGTDGSDGPTDDAGAVIDGETLQRGKRQGVVPADYLKAADAGTFLNITGDLVSTGPTGTNVMDLVIAVRIPRDRSELR
ncbi:MAG: glycerate kinase type-2 family protein [bacterium]